MPEPKTHRRRRFGALVATVIAAALPLAAVGGLRHAVSTADPTLPELAFSTVVVDRNGELLRPFKVGDGRWRLETRIEDVDPDYLAMLKAFEDRRFAEHRGIDPIALARAASTAAISGRAVSGGSTLTMQVARLIDGRRTAAPSAKAAQIVHALALEQGNGKDAILTHYLNRAPFGGNLEGVRTASLAYFGKEPLRLSAAEAALLVALPQSPEARRLDGGPGNRANALTARNRVLDRALAAGVIDARRHARARAEALPAGRISMPLHAPHLAEQLVAAEPHLSRHVVTLDRRLQADLETLARTRGDRFGNGLSVAIMVADHRTGEILATVGASDYLDRERQGFVDMTRAVRSPGSALKPLIYGLAFHRGLAHPETLIEDREMAFGGYRPQNFDGAFRSTVTVREALQLSLNVPAVQVLEEVGPARLLSALRLAGVEPVLAENTTANLAMGLGGLGTTLTDLVALQAMVANGGRAVTLHTAPGDVEPGPRVLDERAAWQVAAILSGVRDPNGITLGAYAFKTGTSYGHRDAWAIGFDGRYTVGVWVGRPDGRPLDRVGRKFAGIDVAAPILDSAFSRIGPLERLPGPPPGTRLATTAALPPPLRRFGVVAGEDPQMKALAIAYPPDGSRIEQMPGSALQVVVERGTVPLAVLVNGAPATVDPWRRTFEIAMDGAGQKDIVVIDTEGRTARTSVFLQRPGG